MFVDKGNPLGYSLPINEEKIMDLNTLARRILEDHNVREFQESKLAELSDGSYMIILKTREGESKGGYGLTFMGAMSHLIENLLIAEILKALKEDVRKDIQRLEIISAPGGYYVWAEVGEESSSYWGKVENMKEAAKLIMEKNNEHR